MSVHLSCKWFLDLYSADEGYLHGVKATVCSRKTPYQLLEILDTTTYGRCLVLDGKLQSSEADEFIYHEALTHPAMLLHPAPRKVCVVGGGEGATLREVLRYPSVETAVMVDIDRDVVEACREHLPSWHQGAFDDPRTRLLFQDARAYLEETQETFDVILVDISEPLEGGPAFRLFTREFYQVLRKRLGPEGTVAIQAGSVSIGRHDLYTAVASTLKTAFSCVAPYCTAVPSFAMPWGFVLAGTGDSPTDLSPETVDRRLAERVRGELRFYDGLTHRRLFSLPKHLRQALAEQTRILTDASPMFVFSS